MNTATFLAADGTEIYYYEWLPELHIPIKGIVQIAHGMAEHAQRYHDFAHFLNEKGFVVYANDHRGHGQTAKNKNDIGYFASNKGWFTVVDDMNILSLFIKSKWEHKPLFLFGHSMGALLSSTYITQHAQNIKGLILCGLSGTPGIIKYLAFLIIFIAKILKGKKGRVKLLDTMSFGAFNKKIKNPKTPFDWLSTDAAEVDKYIKDPLCGTLFTVQFFDDLLKGISYNYTKNNALRIPKTLPIYMISGTHDPVGEFTKGVKKAHKFYLKAGLTHLSLKFFANKRHELINESHKIEIYNDIHNWLNIQF